MLTVVDIQAWAYRTWHQQSYSGIRKCTHMLCSDDANREFRVVYFLIHTNAMQCNATCALMWHPAVKVVQSCQTATGEEVQCFSVSTEGRVDTNVIETGLEFRWVSVNTSVADNSKKTNEPLTSPEQAARSAGEMNKELFSGINPGIECIHADIRWWWKGLGLVECKMKQEKTFMKSMKRIQLKIFVSLSLCSFSELILLLGDPSEKSFVSDKETNEFFTLNGD